VNCVHTWTLRHSVAGTPYRYCGHCHTWERLDSEFLADFMRGPRRARALMRGAR